MKTTYHANYRSGCRVPAPSVSFGVGGCEGFAGQFLGKGTNKGDKTRRSRITASVARQNARICVTGVGSRPLVTRIGSCIDEGSSFSSARFRNTAVRLTRAEALRQAGSSRATFVFAGVRTLDCRLKEVACRL